MMRQMRLIKDTSFNYGWFIEKICGQVVGPGGNTATDIGSYLIIIVNDIPHSYVGGTRVNIDSRTDYHKRL